MTKLSPRPAHFDQSLDDFCFWLGRDKTPTEAADYAEIGVSSIMAEKMAVSLDVVARTAEYRAACAEAEATMGPQLDAIEAQVRDAMNGNA